jgi:hypothetical protein
VGFGWADAVEPSLHGSYAAPFMFKTCSTSLLAFGVWAKSTFY